MYAWIFKKLAMKTGPRQTPPAPAPYQRTSLYEIACDFRHGQIDADTAAARMAKTIAATEPPQQIQTEAPMEQLVMRRGGAKMIKLLLDNGADANAANDKGETLLMRAAQVADAEAMRVLLDAGADAAKTRTEPPRAIIGDAQIGGGTRDVFHDVIINRLDETEELKNARRDCLQALMERGHQPSESDLFSVYINRPHLRPLFPGIAEARALADAAGNGGLAKVEELLAQGVKPDSAADYGANTALIEAIGAGHTAIAKRLLEAGADPDLQSPQHRVMPLDKAIQCNQPEIFDLLLEKGASPGDLRCHSIRRVYDTSENARKYPDCSAEMAEHVKTRLAARELVLKKPVTVGKPLKIARQAAP